MNSSVDTSAATSVFSDESVAGLRKHFTASAVVIEQSHILLVHHKRIGAWLPPGGHIEEHEFPHQAAIREVHEETGLHISIPSSHFSHSSSEASFFLPEPLCIHAVKATEVKGTFCHIDLAYLAKADRNKYQDGYHLPEILANEEVHCARWINLNDISNFVLADNVVEIIDLAKSKLKLED